MLNTGPAPETLLPRGVKDFLPLKASKIAFLDRTLKEIFLGWGFRPVLPPSLENLDVLEKGLGEGLRDKTFRFDDRQSGRLVAIPPDTTPQVARIVATRMQDLPLPLRLCYSGRVLRHAEQQSGKEREIFQAGVELIGLQSPEADAEMIAMAVECLQAIGAPEFTIDIGQVDFFRGIMADLPLSGEPLQRIQQAIGRKDSSGLRQALAPLPLAEEVKQEILALPRLFGGREVLDRARQAVRNPRSSQALDNLSQVLDVLDAYGVSGHVTLDLGEIRGLDYHTGVTFQGYLPGLGHAVCFGGRYDNLTARYGRQAPATGFTFDLLNLLFALDKELDARIDKPLSVLLFQVGDDKRPAQALARTLRAKGYAAARDMYPRALNDSLGYARKMDFDFVMVVKHQDQPVQLIRVADGQESSTSLADIAGKDFVLQPAGE